MRQYCTAPSICPGSGSGSSAARARAMRSVSANLRRRSSSSIFFRSSLIGIQARNRSHDLPEILGLRLYVVSGRSGRGARRASQTCAASRPPELHVGVRREGDLSHRPGRLRTEEHWRHALAVNTAFSLSSSALLVAFRVRHSTVAALWQTVADRLPSGQRRAVRTKEAQNRPYYLHRKTTRPLAHHRLLRPIA